MYNKKLACFYCGKLNNHRIVQHLTSVHHHEQRVHAALLETGSKRKLAFDALKHIGNFKHNANVINDGIGEIIVVRRPKTTTIKVEEYVPCVHCYGFFKTNELWRHNKQCGHRTGDFARYERFVFFKSKILLAGSLKGSTDDVMLEKHILQLMRHDQNYHIITGDSLI